nr:MAG TPA: hypothetical protein [Caudoviricetes sp.]DAU42252.1 MAG TPA: hypothetical protein [Caudoviricetes sp.]
MIFFFFTLSQPRAKIILTQLELLHLRTKFRIFGGKGKKRAVVILILST